MSKFIPGSPRARCALAGAIRLLVAASATCALVIPASAHGFGERYDLPLPLALYLYGTAAVVALSFAVVGRSEEHTSELQSLMRISYAVFCLKKKKKKNQ